MPIADARSRGSTGSQEPGTGTTYSAALTTRIAIAQVRLDGSDATGPERADAPARAGASRDGWSGVRTGSATGREGEPIDDAIMIGGRAQVAKDRSCRAPGPFVLRTPSRRGLAEPT